MSEWYKCIVKQETYQNHYGIDAYNIGTSIEHNGVVKVEPVLIEEKEVYEGFGNGSCLKEGESLYISSLNKTVYIFKTIQCLKTLDEDVEIIYYIEPEYKDNKEERIVLNEKCELLNKLASLQYENRGLKVKMSICSEKVKNKFWNRFMKSNTGEKHDIKADIDIFNTVLLAFIGLTLAWIAISIV